MCGSLIAQGLDVLLATTDDDLERGNGAATPECGVVTNYKNLPVIFFPTQLGASFKYSRPFALWLNEHVPDYDIVHIHAVFNHSCMAAARACRESQVPYVVRPLGTLDPWSLRQKPLRKKLFWYGGIKTMLTRAAAIHYTTRGEQQAVEKSLKLNHGAVVPLGVDIVAKREGETLNQTSKLSERPYVLVLSRLHPKKALEVLLEAFLSLIKRPEFQEWRLVLAGEGPADYVALLKRMVEEHEATDAIIFPGWLDGERKDAALRNAALLALPSHHENFGLCVMESLAYGIPVLVSPQVNLAPEIQAANAGWIAEVDKDSLAVALTAALGSAAERKRRGEAGRTLAASFAWPVVATRLTELYTSVLQRAA